MWKIVECSNDVYVFRNRINRLVSGKKQPSKVAKSTWVPTNFKIISALQRKSQGSQGVSLRFGGFKNE